MRPTVAVITPTTGAPVLRQCVESVLAQSYARVKHYVVIDGQPRLDATMGILREYSQVQVIALPEVTGDKGYQGHRIYAATPFILNADFICYLDEDNWYENDHVESLINLIHRHRLDWAYSLRKIMRIDGTFLCNDDCNSLGRWPSYDGAYHHIDTSCYIVSRDIACGSSEAWNHYDNPTDGAADRILCKYLMAKFPFFHTSGKYTVNYRIGSRHREKSEIRFYTAGNDYHSRIYHRYPWAQTEIAGLDRHHPHLNYRLETS